MNTVKGYAARSRGNPFGPFMFTRRDLRAEDVRIDIHYSGVCHSDLHTARGEWDGSIYPDGIVYPCVPGHEILGRVAAVGASVDRFQIGDLVGVGTMVDSCRQCGACLAGLEQHCERHTTWTYNSPDRVTSDNTYGGYSESIVVRQEFVLKIGYL